MKKRHTSKSTVHTRKISTREELNFRIRRINEAIANKDLEQLRRLSQSENGFVNDGLRRRAWPLLLHCSRVADDWDEKKAEEHKDERQVLMDVERSLNNYPTNLTSISKKQKQDDLNDIIVEILRKNPLLHYYQGYHDICASFLIVMATIELLNNNKETEKILSVYIYALTITMLEDPTVFEFLDTLGVLPYYCLSWILTWCSHDITEFSKVARLFDFFLSSNPLMPVYFAAATVLSRREPLLALEPDNAVVHHFLSKFPQDADIDAIISKAIELERNYSPEELQRKAGKGLDETSTVNTYSTLWLRLHPGDPLPKLEVERILGLLPTERKPIKFRARKKSRTVKEQQVANRTAWTLFAVGAGMGTAVLFMLNNQAVRWVKTEMVVGWAMRDNGWRLSAR
ncbi:rab-GTPase-TBC domain-containing protein [Endogone sp. FLAS-F59071]|nr:rab-GTPase-TBC domain-containing protein [Endogone sp. FLAS-F59071]|eukprot:RUS13455.1 rab-GTPase-TBC domain-containing protein [Endogone sp. FLAS-F59071]